MNLHDPKRIVYAKVRQFWRAFAYVMHLHENRYEKRAGVAGLRARANSSKLDSFQHLAYKFVITRMEVKG